MSEVHDNLSKAGSANRGRPPLWPNALLGAPHTSLHDAGEPPRDIADHTWLEGVADAIEDCSAALTMGPELRQRGCLSAAVYLEGALQNLGVAIASLRLTAECLEFEPGEQWDDVDPRLAEWLN
jgi:hypothetical protein